MASALNKSFFVFSILINTLLLWYFHDRFWGPADEGFYAQVASRFLDGKTLSLEIQQLVPGLVHWIHGCAFRLFGNELLSLRYPLLFSFLLLSVFLYHHFKKIDAFEAFLISIIPVSLGFLQYINPNHHWYCYIAAIVFMLYLKEDTFDNKFNVIMCGVFLGVIYQFRQLTGVWIGFAAVTYFIFLVHDKNNSDRGCLVQGVLGLFFIALFYYLMKATDIFGFFLIGIWPFMILLILMLRARVPDKVMLKMLLPLTLGFILAFIPLLTYHFVHHSTWAWIDDTFLRILQYTDNSYLHRMSYANLFKHALSALFDGSIIHKCNGLYWMVLLLVFIVNGFFAVYAVLFKKHNPREMNILILSSFFCLVSLHYAVPIYAYHSVGVALISILCFLQYQKFFMRRAVSLIILWLCLMAVIFHAAQPISRGFTGIMQGQRIPLVKAHGTLPLVNLWIEKKDVDLYSRIINIIKNETNKTDKIFVLPYNPEIYFMSGRNNILYSYLRLKT